MLPLRYWSNLLRQEIYVSLILKVDTRVKVNSRLETAAIFEMRAHCPNFLSNSYTFIFLIIYQQQIKQITISTAPKRSVFRQELMASTRGGWEAINYRCIRNQL